MNFPISLHRILSVIPTELTLRDHPITMVIGIGLFTSFVLIALAKLIKTDVYFTMLMSLTKTKGLRAYTREAYPVNKTDTLILILNYLVATSTVLLIIVGLPTVHSDYEVELSMVAPIAVLAWSIGGMFLTVLITGEKNVFVEPVIMKLVGAQFLGIFYFVISLLWVLNSFDQTLLIKMTLGAFVLESILRLSKSISVVYRQGVSYYYIILYFCTLEILPISIAYYVVVGEFD
ncbi:MAG: DUF4271 domain-containing protein [Crocinitomicaceae bacterium]|nr:DUF4271 domain-containing protein [Crocinitomicaceae bacterium]MDG1775851.1 DUF4271 domain-containing protein [Crocinitomicaceae bacterium]